MLLDGAAAQYGTDAIAGVVNIILKKKSSGGQLSATAGQLLQRPAAKRCGRLSSNMGCPVRQGLRQLHGREAFSAISPIWRRRSIATSTPQGQISRARTPVTAVGANGVGIVCTTGNRIPNTVLRVRHQQLSAHQSDRWRCPEFSSRSAIVNSGYDFSDNLNLYAFGTIGHKFGKGFENVRMPNQVIATAGLQPALQRPNPQWL